MAYRKGGVSVWVGTVCCVCTVGGEGFDLVAQGCSAVEGFWEPAESLRIGQRRLVCHDETKGIQLTSV